MPLKSAVRRKSDGDSGFSEIADLFFGCRGGTSYVAVSKSDRTRAATRFVHDGGGDTDAVASSRGVAEKRLFIDHAGSSAGREGDKDQSNSSLGVHGEIEWAS
jgi:hypothetical protein